ALTGGLAPWGLDLARDRSLPEEESLALDNPAHLRGRSGRARIGLERWNRIQGHVIEVRLGDVRQSAANAARRRLDEPSGADDRDRIGRRRCNCRKQNDGGEKPVIDWHQRLRRGSAASIAGPGAPALQTVRPQPFGRTPSSRKPTPP